jgi:serine/threonine-protein kinase
LYERRFDAAVELGASIRLESQINPAAYFDYAIPVAYAQELGGHRDAAHAAFERVIKAIKPAPDATVAVDEEGLPILLALAYAGSGDREAAYAQAQRAVDAYRNDAFDLPTAEIALAQIRARFGDRDAAIGALPHLLEVPAGTTVALLRLDPMWDPLRADPRFQKLIAPAPAAGGSKP